MTTPFPSIPVAATLREAADDPALTLDVARELLRDAAAGIRYLYARAAAHTEPAEGREAVRGSTLRFGLGAWIVNTGTYGDEPCVFIDDAPTWGKVGERAPDVPPGVKPFMRLLFPTAEQAKAVQLALTTPAAGDGAKVDAERYRTLCEILRRDPTAPYTSHEMAVYRLVRMANYGFKQETLDRALDAVIAARERGAS